MYQITQFSGTVNIWPPSMRLPVDEIRDSVAQLVDELKVLPQIELPVVHEFLEGVYVRTVHMEAGAVIVGKIHKQEHIAIISKGRATVLTENGVMEISAPYLFKSPPGVQRALLIHEDMVWSTIHRSDETTLEKLEDQLIAKDFNDPKLIELANKAKELACRGA